MGVAPSNLSLILNEKKGISVKTALEIAKKLKLTSNEKELFINLVSYKCARSNKERLKAKNKLDEIKVSPEKNILKEDHFKIISDWYHFAIVELMTTQNFRSDLIWISKKLNITLIESTEAIERLTRLGLIKKVNNKFISKRNYCNFTLLVFNLGFLLKMKISLS